MHADLLRIIAAIVLPPLCASFKWRFSLQFWLNVLLPCSSGSRHGHALG
jgi:uncharacterized membrane protein YqaE (UPF0057 family)